MLLSQDCVHAGSAVSVSTGKKVIVHMLIGFQKKPNIYCTTTGRKESYTYPYDVPYPVWSETLKQSVQKSTSAKGGWHHESVKSLKACVVATEQGLDVKACIPHRLIRLFRGQFLTSGLGGNRGH